MTPRPTYEKLASLHGRDDRWFADWLGEGIAAFVVRGAGRASFPGAGNYVGWAGAVEEDLAVIHDALGRSEQVAFRAGLATALGEREVEPEEWPAVATSLLRLAALTRTRAVLDNLPAIAIAAGTLPDAAAHVAFCRLALDVAIELATPVARAIDCLTQLVTSPGFRDEIAAPALVALVRAAPQRLPEHLALLRPALSKQYGPARRREAGRTEAQRDELIATLARWAPVASVASAFDPARRGAGLASDWAVHDWLCRGLAESEDPRVAAVLRDVRAFGAVARAPDLGDVGRPTAVASPATAPDEFEEALGPLPEPA